MCRQRQQKTKTLVQKISGMAVVPNLLPDEDKVAIMEWLLQRNKQELGMIYKDDSTPAFVAKCIELLTKRPITAFCELMQSFKNDGDKEVDKKEPKRVGFQSTKKAV